MITKTIQNRPNAPKLIIYTCDSHDHSEGHLDGKLIWSNDYCYENVIRLAKDLGWDITIIKMTSDEFEEQFA